MRPRAWCHSGGSKLVRRHRRPTAAGQQQAVAFSFTPEEGDEPAGIGGPSGIDAGRWVVCHARCVVKGGFVPVSGMDDTQTVDVVLRGWLSA